MSKTALMRIEQLSEESGTTVRNIRVYQEKLLLPQPIRRGRTALYSAMHLKRLRQISSLLDRGYTFATITELFIAERAGLDITEVINSDSPREVRRNRKLKNKLTLDDVNAFVGEEVTDSMLEVGRGSQLFTDVDNDRYHLHNPQVLAAGRELINLGISPERLTEMGQSTLEMCQQLCEIVGGAMVDAVNNNAALAALSAEEKAAVLLNIVPKSASTTRFMFKVELEQTVARLLDVDLADAQAVD